MLYRYPPAPGALYEQLGLKIRMASNLLVPYPPFWLYDDDRVAAFTYQVVKHGNHNTSLDPNVSKVHPGKALYDRL